MANKQQPEQAYSSMLPDEMIAGGLADDFDGVIREATFGPWDYMGNIPDPILGARIKYERLDVDKDADDEERFHVAWYSAGSLEHFKPSMNGTEPSLDSEGGVGFGPYATRVGQRQALNNNTNWAQFLRSCLDANFPRPSFRPSIEFLVGAKGHFNRLPPDKKGGQFKPKEGEEGKTAGRRDVLCMTRFDGMVGANGSAGVNPTSSPSTASSTSKTSTAPAGGSASLTGLDDRLRKLVVDVIRGKGAVRKTAVSGEIMKKMKGDKEVNKAVKRVVESDFLSALADASVEDMSIYGGGVSFDADAGTVEFISAE